MIMAMKGALMRPTKRCEIDGRPQPVDEGRRRDAGVEPGDEDRPAERREIGDDGEARHRDDERDEARKDQNADRVEADAVRASHLLAPSSSSRFLP